MYDPTIGRWIEEDPVGFQGGDPDLYGFEHENPVNMVDPSGLLPPSDPVPGGVPGERPIIGPSGELGMSGFLGGLGLKQKPPTAPAIDTNPWRPSNRPNLKNPPFAQGSNSFGTFTSTMKPYSEGSGLNALAGLKGTITFTPNGKSCPKCNQIKMIQVLRTIGDSDSRPGEDSTGTQGGLTARPDPQNGVGMGWHIDLNAGVVPPRGKPPLFYNDVYQSALNAIGFNNSMGVGPATIWDKPQFGGGPMRFEFETVAICVDTMQVLGSLRWGFVVNTDANLKPFATALPELPDAVGDKPTPSFTAAINQFNTFFDNRK